MSNEENVAPPVQKTLADMLPIEEKPWKGTCCRRCWNAATPKKKCRCRCRGLNHQTGRLRIKEKESDRKESIDASVCSKLDELKWQNAKDEPRNAVCRQ